MGKIDKIYDDVMSGNSDSNINFTDLCNLLTNLGFAERIESSHHIYVLPAIQQIINLQKDGAKAKNYQVKQVRKFFKTHNIRKGDNNV